MEEIDEKIYEKAVKLLAIRMHTTGEMHQKLKARGFRDSGIRPVLRRLEELKFLDDEHFAQIFVENLKRYKDFGYYGVKAKLLQRHIPGDLAVRALDKFFTLQDELAVAERLVKKLSSRKVRLPAGQGSALGGKKRAGGAWEKLARGLQSRGFRTDAVRGILSHFA